MHKIQQNNSKSFNFRNAMNCCETTVLKWFKLIDWIHLHGKTSEQMGDEMVTLYEGGKTLKYILNSICIDVRLHTCHLISECPTSLFRSYIHRHR